jgi:hypothetical protein
MTMEHYLTSAEKSRLETLEAVIEENMKGFVKVGMALAEIRDSRLYRDEYPTFEDYCRQVWDMGKRYSYYQIEATKVVENIQKNVHNCAQIPANESQVRPLTQLSTAQQIMAWESVLDLAKENGGKITARLVSSVVEAILSQASQEKREYIKREIQREVPDEFSQAFNQVIFYIEKYKENNWNGIDRQKLALYFRQLEAELLGTVRRAD